MALLNLSSTRSEDDDGKSAVGEGDFLSEDQIEEITSRMDAAHVNHEKFLKVLKVESLSDVYAKRYDDLIRP